MGRAWDWERCLSGECIAAARLRGNDRAAAFKVICAREQVV